VACCKTRQQPAAAPVAAATEGGRCAAARPPISPARRGGRSVYQQPRTHQGGLQKQLHPVLLRDVRLNPTHEPQHDAHRHRWPRSIAAAARRRPPNIHSRSAGQLGCWRSRTIIATSRGAPIAWAALASCGRGMAVLQPAPISVCAPHSRASCAPWSIAAPRAPPRTSYSVPAQLS
jgi:hypothetical protein